MARPHCPGSCVECQKLCAMEPEHLRPSCWFGQVCPYKLIEADDEIAAAYRYAGHAVVLEERYDVKTKATTEEWTFTREAVQWACWLHALESREDRMKAFDLIMIVGAWSRKGREWDVLRALARAAADGGDVSPEQLEILAADVGLED